MAWAPEVKVKAKTEVKARVERQESDEAGILRDARQGRLLSR